MQPELVLVTSILSFQTSIFKAIKEGGGQIINHLTNDPWNPIHLPAAFCATFTTTTTFSAGWSTEAEGWWSQPSDATSMTWRSHNLRALHLEPGGLTAQGTHHHQPAEMWLQEIMRALIPGHKKRPGPVCIRSTMR